MKQKLKQNILNAYEIPEPLQKEEFIKSLNFPKIRWYDFLLYQFGYIRKKIWIASILLFLAAILLGSLLQKGDMKLLWSVSAIIPFLALLGITEIARSAVFGLAELEMSTRYNLRGVLLARMCIIGIGNFILILSLTCILAGRIEVQVLKLGIYFMIPYLLTNFISYVVVNRSRSKDISYYCAAVAASVSGSGLFFGRIWEVIYQQQYFILWLVAFVVLIAALSKEIRKLIHNTEELIWNSYSTV